MIQGKIDIKQILNELFREQDPQRPLSAQELEAWERGPLSEGQRREFQRRLIMDPQGVRQLLEKDQPAGASLPSTEEAMASWQQFKHKLAAQEGTQEQGQLPNEGGIVPFPDAKLTPVKPPLFYRFSAVAASILLVIVIPQSIRFSSVSQQLAAEKLPTLNAKFELVYLEDSATRGDDTSSGESEKRLTVSNEKLHLRLVLPPKWEDLSPWYITILDPAGNQVFKGNSKMEDRAINLNLHLSFFTHSGIHTIGIQGKQGSKRLEETFQINIKIPE